MRLPSPTGTDRDTGHMAPVERPDVVTAALAELVTVTAERTLA